MINKGIVVLIVIVSGLIVLLQRPQIPLQPLRDEGYIAMEVKAPQLYGWKLKLYSTIGNLPIIGSIIAGILMKQNDFYAIHHLAYYSHVMPTYEPLKLLSDNEYSKHVTYSNEYDYSNFLTNDDIRNKILENENRNLKIPENSENSENSNKYTTIESIYNAYKTGKKTPLDIAKEALLNAKKLSNLNIFIQLNEDNVLLQAKESTNRWKNNKQLSILDGIPVAVKDEIVVSGYNTSYGTQFMMNKNGISNKDDEIVSRLRKLGCIIFGKTNMHEIGIQPTGYNAFWKNAKNPYSINLNHDTGGSSSGSAAAVSAQLVPIALGADGGGSIRVPSSLNGIVGLKATYGRIPYLPAHCCWSVVHTGVLANTLKDQMIAYMAIAGIDSDISVISPPKHLHNVNKFNDLSDLTIGIYWDWFSHAQKEIVAACWDTLTKLRDDYGIKIKNITIPHLDVIGHAHAVTILSEWLVADWKVANREFADPSMRYSASTEAMLSFFKHFQNIDFLAAQQIKTMALDYLENKIFKNNVDIIVTPTTASVAFEYINDASETGLFDSKMISELVRFMSIGNFVGIPGLTMPVGYTNVDGNGNVIQDGTKLPIGIQLMANHWNEHILFRVANAIEKINQRQLPPQKNTVSYHL